MQERGKSLALVACSVSLLATACQSSGGEDPITGPTSSTTQVPVAATSLQAGDCVNDLTVGSSERVVVTSIDVTACSAPHEVEVFDSFLLPAATDYPGRERVVRAADEGCAERLDLVTPTPRGYGLLSVWPTNESWRTGDRQVTCAAFHSDGSRFEEPELFSTVVVESP